jgi:hypothetical protein
MKLDLTEFISFRCPVSNSSLACHISFDITTSESSSDFKRYCSKHWFEADNFKIKNYGIYYYM